MSNAEVKLNAAVYAFFVREAEAVHTLCDRALVPRAIDGELSMSQRVSILEGAYRGLAARLGSADMFPTTH